MSAEPSYFASPSPRLPLATLYLSERCNSRCVSCDYWRNGQADMTLATVKSLLPDLAKLGTRVVLISGGEPLVNPEWAQIAQLLRDRGLRLWLLTSGLALAKHARKVASLFDAVTVSMDGADAGTYRAIRGVDAFAKVCEGVRAARTSGAQLGLRVTVQRANYRQLPQFVMLARELGVRQLSFVAVDVANYHAFARHADFSSDLALQPADLPVLEQLIADMERDCATDFSGGLIADSPRKLRRIHQYFAAVCGQGSFPPVRCNVFDYSAVIAATGRVSPCFFIGGPSPPPGSPQLAEALDSSSMVAQREQIRSGGRPECARCVCSLWRDPGQREVADFLMRS